MRDTDGKGNEASALHQRNLDAIDWKHVIKEMEARPSQRVGA